MTELETLLELSGHNQVNGPGTSGSVFTVLDTDIATWPISKLRKVHADYDIHIVPADPSEPMAFDARTCEALGINMDQPREVHGKSFGCIESRDALIIHLIANQLRQGDYFSHMQQSTLADFFTLLSQGDPKSDNVNFLDIPLPFHRIEDTLVKSVSPLLPD